MTAPSTPPNAPWDVCILGAGAAGLFAAIHCAARGRRVAVLDRAAAPARKLAMSGGGRCNVTNRHAAPADFLCATPHFVRSALARWSAAAMLDWLHARGVQTREEEDGKRFCQAGAKALAALLADEARRLGARLVLGTTLRDVRKDGDFFQIDTDGGAWRCASLILALGGPAWPSAGASDLGHVLARRLGLELVPPRPGLVPLLSGEGMVPFCRELAGVAHCVAIAMGGRVVKGPLLFTHRGVSGPAVLDASLFRGDLQDMRVDWLPGVDLPALLSASPRREIRAVLAGVMPARLAAALCAWPGLGDLSGPAVSLGKKKSNALASLLHAFPFPLAGDAGWDKAEVTLGGVSCRRVSSKTMESKDVPGLFLAGEVLDVTGRLGGFNLQWAWSSAWAAGQSA